MAERLNDEQLQSLSAQMKKRAEGYETSARESFQQGGTANQILGEHADKMAQRLRDVIYGVRLALGEVEPKVELGPATTEIFDPNLPVSDVGASEFWIDFRARVERKQYLGLPDRPVDAHITGGHEIKG